MNAVRMVGIPVFPVVALVAISLAVLVPGIRAARATPSSVLRSE